MMNKNPYRVIELTKGYVAVISAEDYRRVNKHRWHVHISAGRGRDKGHPYARANIGGKKVYLHRFIEGNPPAWLPIDHINHCTLDCRRNNLQAVTHSENLKNRRPYKRKAKP